MAISSLTEPFIISIFPGGIPFLRSSPLEPCETLAGTSQLRKHSPRIGFHPSPSQPYGHYSQQPTFTLQGVCKPAVWAQPPFWKSRQKEKGSVELGEPPALLTTDSISVSQMFIKIPVLSVISDYPTQSCLANSVQHKEYTKQLLKSPLLPKLNT